MIERFVTNELSLKRWRRFKQRRLAVISLFFLFILIIFSFTAHFWANSTPIILKYEDHWYYPIYKKYDASEFGQTNQLVPDYRKIEISENDFVLWPVIRWDPYESNKSVDSYPSPPTIENLMGTDDRGRDIFARLLYGFKYSFSYAILVWMITYFIGTILGGVMGFFGGKIDFFGQRIVEVLSTVPQFFLLIIIISIFQPSLWLLVALSSIFGWISISYYIRGEFLKNRKKDFVEGARALGAKNWRLLWKHILPNSLSPLITFSPFVIAGNIVSLASLDYLGFGLTPPTPSWGELLNQAQKYFTIGWWLAVYPSLVLFITLTFLTLIGEAVRDAMDPNL